MRRQKTSLTILMGGTIVFLLEATGLFSQIQPLVDPDVHSEGNFYEQNGILYVDAIVVKFKDRVIDLSRGVRYAAMSDIRPNFPSVTGIISSFEQKFGSIKLVKQILNTHWGDVTRRHIVTGELVQIHDLSQLFTLRFSQPVPLDSTIQAFRRLPEIEYAHEPISIVYFDEPNDSMYSSQWNLQAINAVKAWDITHGSSATKIGIVDNGVEQTHNDLQGKIDGGDGVQDDHGTRVAGVAAAATNNTTGVASLGWDLRLFTYGNGHNDPSVPGYATFLAQNISEAAEHAHIVNMSFGTVRLGVSADELPASCINPPPPGILEKLQIPQSYQEIQTAVNNAITQGVICIASAGNDSKNKAFLGEYPNCDPWQVPFINYPAYYPNVIAVSATQLVSGNEQFMDEWNYGSFVDVSAPGVDIWTTYLNNSYINTQGTSFSAPLVSALAGLIKSVNPGLSIQQVTNVLNSTAEKLDPSNCDGSPEYNQNGWNPCLGYGRINAYQALLMTHAYQNKSVSSTATASNNGRRMVKTSDNRYHLVFESGITSGGNVLSEIFYRRSNIGGTSWETPMRLSRGDEQNRYPSIAERADGSTKKLYVVWQRKTGTNTYSILFRHFNGSTWDTVRTITSGVSVTTGDPLPTIGISTPSSGFEIMVAYRTGSGLKSRRSTSPTGSSWESELTMTSTTSAANPNLTLPSGNLPQTSWDDGSNVFYQIFYSPYWSGLTNVSSGLGSSANTHQYPSFVNNGNRHIAWQATDPTQGNKKVIFHNLNLNLTVFTKFYGYTNYLRPSLSGRGNGGALAFWHDQTATPSIRYARHNGSSWEGSSQGTIYGTNGQDASAAIMNPPGSPIKAVWHSAGSSPYTLSLGSELSKSTELENIVYSRQLIYAREGESVLALRLFAPQITGENKALEFSAVANEDSLVAESLAEKLTFDFVVPAKAEDAKIGVEIYTKEAAKLLQNGASALQVGFELIDLSQNSRVALASMEATDGINSSKSLTLTLANVRGKSVRLRPVLAGLDLGKVRGALVHEYGVDETRAPQAEALTSQTASSSYEFSVQAKPNPFNPATNIQFSLPAEGMVTLRIYNLQGQLVRDLLHEQRAAGIHTVSWDGRNDRGSISASGIYFLRLESGKQVKVSRLTLVR
jgi:hypothetical protein